MSSTLDDLLTGGGKGLKFETPGDTYTGVVINSTVRQMTEFGTGTPLTFDNGDPQEQIVINLQTEQRDPSDPSDDGTRTLYIKGFGVQLRAFRAAVQAAGGKPEVGDTIKVTYTGNGERPARGGYPPKLYAYEITKGDSVDRLAGTPTPQATPTAPPAQSPAAAGEDTPAEKAQKLIALGMNDDQIQQVTGLEPAIIAAIRGNANPATPF